jgi:TPR repeat protein
MRKMKRWNGLLRVVVGLLLCAMSLAAAAAGNTVEKFALVIGNRDYPDRKDQLSNTLRDTELMTRSLERLGFTVTKIANLTLNQMQTEVASFSEKIPQGATALVYYAGHGMQVGNTNYLVPVDMVLTSEKTVPFKAYPLKTLLERLSASKAAVNIVVLDACRHNPFQPSSAVRYRSFADLGLAKVTAPRGTLVAFSTAPGQLAADGKEGNSIYSATLAQMILEPNLDIKEIFEKAASQVRKRTLDDQIPWFESSLSDKYYFLPPEGVTVVAGKPLQYAAAGSGNTGMRRGTEGATPTQPVAWFNNLTRSEWDELDWEIEQRVKRLTADEIPLLEHKADGGNVVVQTTLGLAYSEGIDKAVDPATGKVTRYNASNVKALQWLRKAANVGFPMAQVVLGEMYYSGHGVDRDLVEARRWFEKATSADYTRAKLDLAQMRIQANPADFPEVFKKMIGGSQR